MRRKSAKDKPADMQADDAGLPPHPPNFGDYGVGILAHRLDKLLAHTEGAKTGQDTVAIHQMRVWSRRSRAALDVFRPCFAGKTAAQFACLEREVKNVTRALGAARDLDVMLETLQVRAESLPVEERGGVESFRAYLQSQRADRQQAVTDAVAHLESQHLKRGLDKAARRQKYHAVTLTAPQTPSPEAGNTAATASGAGRDMTSKTEGQSKNGSQNG